MVITALGTHVGDQSWRRVVKREEDELQGARASREHVVRLLLAAGSRRRLDNVRGGQPDRRDAPFQQSIQKIARDAVWYSS